MRSKILILNTLLLLVTACSQGTGTWPDLSAPLPDPSLRERVSEQMPPSKPTLALPEKAVDSMTADERQSYFEETKSTIANAKTAYEQARATFDTVPAENKPLAWQTAQLQLTRLSHAVSELDIIMDTHKPAAELKGQLNDYIVGARKELQRLNPTS